MSPDTKLPMSWSPDGRFLLYEEQTSKTRVDLWVLPFQNSAGTEHQPGKPIALLTTPYSEGNAVFSPDGRWVAYLSNETGTTQLYVRSFDPADPVRSFADAGVWQISRDGVRAGVGNSTTWTRGGKELIFEAPDGSVMNVDVTPGLPFTAGIPKKLFDIQTVQTPALEVTPDGQRFLAQMPVAGSVDAPFTVILNWPQVLKGQN